MGSQYGEPNVADGLAVEDDVAYVVLASGSIVAIDLVDRDIKLDNAVSPGILQRQEKAE